MTELSQISGVFRWSFNPDKRISQDCAWTIHRLLTSEPAIKNKSIYNVLGYIDIKNEDLIKFYDFEAEVQNSLFCIASMNWNGYVREEALSFLIKPPSQKTFPFIHFRLAAWVPAVRKVAESGVRQLIEHQEPQFFIRHHQAHEWLLKVKRVDLNVLIRK